MSLISSLLCPPLQTLRTVWRVAKQTNRLNVVNDNILTPSLVATDQRRNGHYTAKTKKRRKTHPFHWLPQTHSRQDVPHKNYLSRTNVKFVDDYIKDQSQQQSPLKTDLLPRQEFAADSVRTGLIARKLGLYPMWTKSGQKLITTALQVVDNHVIRYYSPEEWSEQRRETFYKLKRRSLNKAVVVVGAESADPRKFTSAYRGLFAESGVIPKNKITRFFVTPDAKLMPGTPLMANHFRVGDYVNVYGVTKDHGFQGVIKRWGFKGLDKYRGVTKAHRRPGTIARGRKDMGPWKGTKMPGHMGSERRTIVGLKVWRINTKYNVIWVQGPAVPGDNGNFVYIKDCGTDDKRHKIENPPPFPTFYAEDVKEELPEDIYDKELHPFEEPTVIFEETEAERKAAAAAAKATKKAKIAKIR